MARRKPEAWTPVSVNQIIESALDVVGYGLRGADIAVDLDLAADLPPVSGDADQLNLVLMNLIVNAQHALQTRPPPRRLEIITRSHDGEVQIEVADNGPGIPADIAEHIFDPFFTTKPQGVGTGIGLSVCLGIVTAHRGEIRAASRPQGGAAVHRHLGGYGLRAQAEGGRAGARADRRTGPGGRRRGGDRADGVRGPQT